MKTLNKKLLFVLIILIVPAGLFASFVYKYKQPSTSTPTIPVLKTYHNEEFGFEFQYPADWTLHPSVLKNPLSKFELIGTAPEEKVPNTIIPSILVNIVTPDFADRASISFKNLNASTSTVIVGGVEGTKYEYEFESIPQIAIVLPFGEYRMILGARKEYEGVFNQILSTFQFLNSINLNSQGVIPVAVLTNEFFNARDVIIGSVFFAGAASLRGNPEDVDNDGDLDLILHFDTQSFNLTPADTEATLTGRLDNDTLIKGADSIKIISK